MKQSFDKKAIMLEIDAHVQTSKKIREKASDYVNILPIDEDDKKELSSILKTCTFDVFKDIMDELPNIKKVSDLKEGDKFINPYDDNDEVLTVDYIECISDMSNCNENEVILTAIHPNRKICKYKFNANEIVWLS